MAEPAEFKPRFSEEEISKLVSQYQLFPESFDNREEDLDILEQHAYYYRKPFAKSEKHQDGFIEKSLKQFGKGWIEGYTTLPPEWASDKAERYLGVNVDVGNAPEDTIGGIARGLGHLAGFVGYLPGARIAHKLNLVKTASAMMGLRGKSIPMRAATLAQKKVADSVKPILKDLPDFMQNNEVFKDMASGAFHLGVASGVSSWTHGVNEIFAGAGFGAVAGGFFRGIGNLKGFGKKLEAHQLKPNGSPVISKLEPGQKADLIARTVAGATFQGLPSSLQGATTEEQVYAYTMGAFFGYKEMPYQTRTSREFIHSTVKGNHGVDPALNPKWDTLTPEMQEIVKNDFKHIFRQEEVGDVLYNLARDGGLNLKDIEKMAKMYKEGMEIDETTGEISWGLSKDEIKLYKESYKDDPRFEDPQDLDMHIAKIADLPGKIAGRGGFVDRELSKEAPRIADAKDKDIERIKVADEINTEWKKLHNKSGKPGVNAEEEIYKFISDNYGVTLGEEQKGWWRRWAENTRKKEWVNQIEIVDGDISILGVVLDKNNKEVFKKVNTLGNVKDLSQEPMEIEKLWIKKHKEVFGVDPERFKGFMRVLDHMIWHGKEYDLTRMFEGLKKHHLSWMRQNDYYMGMRGDEIVNAANSRARKEIKKAYTDLHNKMWDDGYYYVGGKGDNKKMYFIRKNPLLHPKETEKFLDIIDKAFKSTKTQKNKGGIKDFKKVFKAGLKNFKKQYPNIKNAEKRYKEIYVNNALYDVMNNGFNIYKDTLLDDFSSGFKKVIGDGFIETAKDYNKRAQIWFNTGLSANPVNVREIMDDKFGIKSKGKFRVGFFDEREAIQENELRLDTPTFKYAETTDGAIYAREGVVDALNLDKGLPTKGKVNKSFIVSPDAEHGALLGKYMIHTASPRLEAYMERAGLHMLIPKSAAKQVGTRKLGWLKFNKDGNIEFLGEKYDLPIDSVRTIMSEITNEKYLRVQRLPKQVLSTLSAYGYKDIDPNIIKDMYEKLSNVVFRGTDKGIELTKKYTNDMSNENLENLVEGLEEVSVQKLLELMRNPKYEKFSAKAYEKILKLNREYLEQLGEEGELSRNELEREREIDGEFETIIERLNKLYPEGSLGAYLHKFSRDYRMTVMRNFVINQLTRPRIENSTVSRMRPWEIGLRHEGENTSALSGKDGQNIFFLDDGFKELRINDSVIIKKRNKLGQIWEDYDKGNYKENQEKIEQILHALVLRIPMDSPSGAHSLKFAGFTGVKGFGSLLHPRTMKALGGADLDGDKAHIFFGGEDVGFKQKWREMYHAQKDEFVDWGGTKPKTRISKTSGINVMRKSKYGNPFVVPTVYDERPAYYKKRGYIRASSTEEAIERYDAWLRGTGDKGYMPKKREAILEDIKSGKLVGKTLKYFKPDASDSHAVRLGKLIDEMAPELLKSKAFEKHNKKALDPKTGKEYRSYFVVDNPEIINNGGHGASKYSPYWREFMSSGASGGRDMLGFAVINRAAVIGAYNAIRGHDGPRMATKKVILDFYGVEQKNKDGSVKTGTVSMNNEKFSVPILLRNKTNNKIEQHRIDFIVKTGDEDLQRFREMARATVALGSDPMDEAGLKGIDVFSNKLLDTLFEYKVYNVPKKGDPELNYGLTKGMNEGKLSREKSHGLQRMFFKINSLLYGKNYVEGRAHTYPEVRSGIEMPSYFSDGSNNSLLPMLAKSLKNVNWSDNLFRHIDHANLKTLYTEHLNFISENDWIREVLGRTTISTKEGAYINKIFKSRIYTKAGLDEISSNKKKFMNFIYDTYTNKSGESIPIIDLNKIPSELKPPNFEKYDYRRALLDHIVLKGEDFLVNDISDMASLRSMIDVIKKHNIPNEVVSEIHGTADKLKSMTVHAGRIRREKDDLLKEDPLNESEEAKSLSMEGRENFAIEDKGTAKLDQVKIDMSIRRWKKGRPQSEKDLFDMLFLGTFQRGNLKGIETAKAKAGLGTKAKDKLEKLEEQARSTSLSRAGMNSKAVADKNIKKFFDDYDSLLSKAKTELSDAEKKIAEEEISGKRKVTSFRDKNGNLIEGEIIETSDLSQTDKYYLEEIAPFEGLHRGKVTDPELRGVYYSLKDHLEHYHNLDARNLNGLFRGLIGKNLNQAHKQDLIVLDNYLKEMRDGSWFNKTMDWLTGRDKNPDIKRSFFWKFPEAVDRDIIREPGMVQFVEDVGPYKDRLGNTIMGKTHRPTGTLGEIQQWSVLGQELSMQKHEEEKEKLNKALRPFVTALEDGDVLYDIAVAQRERNMVPAVLREQYKQNNHRLTRQEMGYIDEWKRVEPIFNDLKNKKYRVPMDEETRIMSGEEVVTEINKVITAKNKEVLPWLRGDEDFIEGWLAKGRDKNGEESFSGLDNLRKEFIKYLTDINRNHEQIPIEKFGIDGLRQITKRIILSLTPKAIRNRKLWEESQEGLEITKYDITGEFPAEFYFPHLSFDRKKANTALKGAWKNIIDDPNITKEEKEVELRKILYHHKQLTGDFLAKDDMTENWDVMNEALSEIAVGRKNRAENILMNNYKRVGNQFSRSTHIPGWDRTPEAYDQYMKNIINTFNKQVSQLASKTVVHSFREKFFNRVRKSGLNKEDARDLTDRWVNFFNLYTQSMMGYPAHIPERIMNDPKMKIKGTPYKWFADSQAKKRIDFIRKKLGIGRKELEKWDLDETVLDELSGVEYSQLQAWGAIEAKWQLASLLAHPKSSIANLYGGSVHTWISVGSENFRNARNFEYLQTNVNPKWKSMKDVEQWINELGIIEEFLIYEAGLNPKIKSKRYDDFVKDVVRKIKRDPEFSDTSLNQLRKKYGVTDTAWNFAASFMRLPERTLRRDAFMSHYLMAKKRFGGAIKDFDNPFLIEMGKRGVKGTQFLYSAPYRPIWTNSALGRVFSRFQLWSWNSVRFRNDTIKQAHIYGFREGTPQYEKFVRMAQADAFMLALSSLFMYSLFENALPAPWNWFQDTADLLMGDDKEKERAFYGSPLGPLQAVVPPALRLLPPLFKGMMTDDYSKLTDYYLWTLPPFGRLIRDIAGPGGAIENPYYAITKFTGMPVMQIADLVKEDRDKPLGGKFIYG